MKKIEPKEGMKVKHNKFGEGVIIYEDFQSGHPNNFEVDFGNGKKLQFSYESIIKIIIIKNISN